MNNAPETLPGKGLCSLHTHTVFCDGHDDVETMCRAAVAKGLCAIGFSAHAPIERAGLKTGWHLKAERLEEYVEAVHAARRRWEGKIAVYAGLEVDYIKGRRSAMDSDIQSLGLDYLIGSVHYLVPPDGELLAVDSSAEYLEAGIARSFGGDGEAMMHAYWDALLEMVALGGFDIVGHLDLVKKQNRKKQEGFPNRLFDAESPAYRRRIEEVTVAIHAGGFVVEVSTGGMNRKHIEETYPSVETLRRLHQHDVPVVISADAHRADHLDGNYDVALKTLADAGYDRHVVFQGRKDGLATWLTVSKHLTF